MSPRLFQLAKRWQPIKRSGFLLAFGLLLSGCFSHVQYLPRIDPAAEAFKPLPERSTTLVGVALSGGGSRAAYFGAAGLEALGKVRAGSEQQSVLEQVSHISSVSGGSLASSYYAMRKPSHEIAVLNADGSFTPDYARFFDQYRATMGDNYQWSIEWRQIVNIRWLNSNQRATSLAEALASAFLDEATFSSLYKRETNQDSPRLILNATLYNTGQRIVMTTVPRADFQYKFVDILQDGLREKMKEQGKDPAGLRPLPLALKTAQETLIPLTFQDREADPRPVPLATAVAASASFPFFIGPITVQVEGQDTYNHVGDGGLFDNQGTESLVQLFLKKWQDKKAGRALVIAFDSSFPFWVKNEKLDHMRNGFDIFVKDSGRIVGIMEHRANAYQAMVWHILQSQQFVLPGDSIIKVIVLRHTDDVWPTDWRSALPEECRKEETMFTKREDVMQRLALIPTLFKVACECDKALLRAAAGRAVEKKKDEIVQFLQAAKEN